MSARLTSRRFHRVSLLAMGTMLATVPAAPPVRAQSFNATSSIAGGSANVITTAGATTVTVDTQQAVIDWTPTDTAIGGGAIDFQSAGTTATFNNGSSVTDFAVLNRILPVDPTRPVQFNGTVNGRVTPVSSPTVTGGSIYFYSPGGIILGSSARIDVGALGLSTAAPAFDPMTGDFINNGAVTYNTAVDGTAVVINNGAQITAPVDQSSYVAIFAPVIRQDGLIDVDGSTALVAAGAGTLTWNSGLFDIQVTVGTDGDGSGVAIEHSGTTGGATGSGSFSDLQRVYAVAVPKNNAITTMIAAGSTLGFDVATAADTFGNAVILSSGYDISGNTPVQSSGAGTGAANVTVTNSIISSYLSVTARDAAAVQAASGGVMSLASNVSIEGGSEARLESSGASSSLTVAGGVTLSAVKFGDSAMTSVMGGNALLLANNGASLTIAGGATVDASAYAYTLGMAGDAAGGTARVAVANGGLISIGSDLSLYADGTGSGDGPMGNGFGGLAQVLANGGGTSLTVGGGLVMSANGYGGGTDGGFTGFAGGHGAGGSAQIDAQGGAGNNVTVMGTVDVTAAGFGGEGNLADSGNGTGGQALISAGVNSMLDLRSDVSIGAQGTSGYAFQALNGGNGTGGMATLQSTAAGAVITVGGTLLVDSTGTSLELSSSSGNGGVGTGGFARIAATGGTVTALGFTGVYGSGFGGDAVDGNAGAGIGGLASLQADGGSIMLSGSLTPLVELHAVGSGGNALGNGIGGDAMSGAARMITGTNGTLTINGDATLLAWATGGYGLSGGTADGRLSPASLVGSTDPFTISGLSPNALLLSNGGQLAITGLLAMGSDATGGSARTSGNGGSAFGGTVGIAAIPAGLGAITIGDVAISAKGTGGSAGTGGSSSTPLAGGMGGAGEGGLVSLMGGAGNGFTGGPSGFLTTGNVTIAATGTGGRGGDGESNLLSGGTGANGGAGGAAAGGIVRVGATGFAGSSTTGGAMFGTVDIDTGASGGAGGNGGTGGPGGASGNGGDGGSVLRATAATNRSAIVASGATVSAGAISFASSAVGGDGGSGTVLGAGGDATAGELDIIITERPGTGQRGSLATPSIIATASATGGAGGTQGASYFGGGPVVSIQHGDAAIGTYSASLNASLASPALGAPAARLFLLDATFNGTGNFGITTPGVLSVFADTSSLSVNALALSAIDFVPDLGGVPPVTPGTLSANSIAISSANNIIIDANLASLTALLLNASGFITTYGLASQDYISVTAAGPIKLGDLISAQDIALLSGGAITTGNLTAATNVSVDGSGTVTLGGIGAGGAVSVTGTSDVAVNGAISGSVVTLAGSSITTAALTATSDVTVNSAGAVTLGGIGAGGIVSVTGGSDVTANGAISGSFVTLSAVSALNVQAVSAVQNANLFASQGTLGLNGIVSAPNIVVASNDIAISAAGGLNAGTNGSIQIFGLNGAGMRIGDGVSGAGYQLDNAEFSRIHGGTLTISAGDIATLPIDMTIGDLSITGPLSGNSTIGASNGAVTFVTSSSSTQSPSGTTPSGTIRVVGSVRASGFGAGNALIFSNNTTEIVAETGLIEIVGAGATLAGTIDFQGQRIHAASTAILNRLQQNPFYAGRVVDLNTPLSTPRPDGIIRADGIDTDNAVGVLVQNTGTPFLPAGFVAFANGPLDRPIPPASGSIDLIINGQLLTASGVLTGVAVHDYLIDDNNRPFFTAESSVNTCLVSAVACAPLAVPQEFLQSDNLTVFAATPATLQPAAAFAEPESEEERKEQEEAAEAAKRSPIPPPAPLISTRPLDPPVDVDDPVSGSGNPALIGGGRQ